MKTSVSEPKATKAPLDGLQFAQTFTSWFDPEEVADVARQTGWMKRQGKIIPLEFAIGAAFGQLSALELTLNAQGACFTEHVSRQGLDQRYNESAVDFFRMLFDRLFAKTLPDRAEPSLAKELAVHFNAVHLVDYT